MKSTTRWLPALLAGIILIAACDRSPTGLEPVSAAPAHLAVSGAERTVEEALIDLDGTSYVFACSDDGQRLEDDEGELVRMQGKIYVKYTAMNDPMGGYHITMQEMPVGVSGTGETSGEVFRVLELYHSAYNQTFVGFDGAWRSERKLTGTETGRQFWLVSTGIYRISYDGTVIVDRSEMTAECRPARR